MSDRFYRQELANLRELAVRFSRAHPALAPMLAGASADPDVERLLEGVAFLTGMVREKIEDEFPEIVQGLMQIVFPHYLRPLPATTIIQFKPKATLRKAFTVPKGVTLASNPVEGTSCQFQTAYEVEAFPLFLKNISYQADSEESGRLKVDLELRGMSLQDWSAGRLRFHIARSYSEASNLYYLFRHFTHTVRILPLSGGSPCVLPGNVIQPVGFGPKEDVIPYPAQSYTGYRLLQEYFILPQKFLFFDVTELDRWKNRGDGSAFQIVFEMDHLPFPMPSVGPAGLTLYATPAVNLFVHDADPVQFDHKRNEYQVIPSGSDQSHYQVFSVNSLIGYQRGSVKARQYNPFELFQTRHAEEPVYHLTFRKSSIGGNIGAWVSFSYPDQGDIPEPETLTASLLCTNGDLPDNLQIGDICRPTGTSPDLLEFSNQMVPTANVNPPLGRILLWRFLSLYSLNYLSISSIDNLRALLQLYIFTDSRDRASVYANLRRVEGIEDLKVTPEDRIVRGHVLRGRKIELKVRQDHFASPGDLYLFCSVLDHFFASYANLNCHTRLEVYETLKGERIQWPPMLGERPLV